MEIDENSNDEMWVVEVTNLLGRKGFVREDENGISILTGGYDMNVKYFFSKDDALFYVKENKIYKTGKIRLVSNQEIASNYSVSPTGEVYVIKNQEDKHIFYNTVNQTYYFDDKQVGYCAWFSKDEVDRFIEQRKSSFPNDVLIAIMMNDPGAEPSEDNESNK